MNKFKSKKIGIISFFFEHNFYFRKCKEIISNKTCPHDKEHHIILAIMKMRELLRYKKLP
ncbi:hypothetical protein [Priestia megaterium]|uniref:hypothetical protein n=1 Tax=Priestia megaterium TaxID=1404 RepID=UPI00358DAA0E